MPDEVTPEAPPAPPAPPKPVTYTYRYTGTTTVLFAPIKGFRNWEAKPGATITLRSTVAHPLLELVPATSPKE